MINTCKGSYFQKSCRQDHATHQDMKSLIYTSEQFQRKFIVFFFFWQTQIWQNRQCQFFVSMRRNSNLKQQRKKSEVKVFNSGPYLQYLRFQIYGRHLTYPILFVYYFIIYTKMQICVFWKWMKLDISLTCKKSPCLLPVKTKKKRKKKQNRRL